MARGYVEEMQKWTIKHRLSHVAAFQGQMFELWTPVEDHILAQKFTR